MYFKSRFSLVGSQRRALGDWGSCQTSWSDLIQSHTIWKLFWAWPSCSFFFNPKQSENYFQPDHLVLFAIPNNLKTKFNLTILFFFQSQTIWKLFSFYFVLFITVRCLWIFPRYSIDAHLMFSRCSQDVCRIFPGCFQDAPMGLVGLVEFDDHFKWKYGL